MAVLELVQCPAVESIRGKVSGAWVFKGTYLPVATVIENLKGGVGVCPDDDCFPSLGKGGAPLMLKSTDPAAVCKNVATRIL